MTLEVIVIGKYHPWDAEQGLFKSDLSSLTKCCWTITLACLAGWAYNYHSKYGFTPAFRDQVGRLAFGIHCCMLHFLGHVHCHSTC